MKKEDIIYKDSMYEIYKRNVSDAGTTPPLDCLNIIDICTIELSRYKRGGFMYKEDYAKIIDDLISQLDSLKE